MCSHVRKFIMVFIFTYKIIKFSSQFYRQIGGIPVCSKYRILGECLLISSLPGKALRTHVDIARLTEPGKLDIKRREPGILFISLPIVEHFKLAIMT